MTTTPSYASARPLYYRHSGKFPPLSPVLGILAGGAVGVVCAIIYAYIIVWIPFIYVSFFATAGVGAAVGLACGVVLKKTRTRNVPVAAVAAMIAATLAYVVAWVFWLYALLNRYAEEGQHFTLGDILESPGDTLALIGALNAKGTWSIGKGNKEPVSGIALSIVWFGEFVIIYGTAVWCAVGQIKSLPFCENCGRWGVSKHLVETAVPPSAPAFKTGLERRDFESIQKLGPATNPSDLYAYTLEGCPDCDTTQTLCVKQVTVTTNGKGERSTKTKQIVNRLWLAPEEVVAVATSAALVQAAAAPAQPPADAPGPGAEPAAPMSQAASPQAGVGPVGTSQTTSAPTDSPPTT